MLQALGNNTLPDYHGDGRPDAWVYCPGVHFTVKNWAS